jgi:hypothetical protein
LADARGAIARDGRDPERVGQAIEHQLAQLNIGLAKGPMDGPAMAGFKAALEPINALADKAHGSVWRLQTEDGDATAIRPYEDERMIGNMSVWESIDALRAFAYTSGHTAVTRHRTQWFEKLETFTSRRSRRPRSGSEAPPDAVRIHLQGELPRAGCRARGDVIDTDIPCPT